ncbi:MAG: thioredoxin domain-containing protein [Crocinitomicaceae bacterium]|nr:thioredoxin domain-containing protein [Crocinitomicaceae bacterium]
MKKFFLISALVISSGLWAGTALSFGLGLSSVSAEESITWYDFETAIDLNKKEKKPIFIDIYTSWCGWCKKMDAGTFQDPDVIKFMNKNFLAVKLDAEQKEAIVFKEKLYEYQSYGRSSYNELAVQLLDSKMSFPSFVVLNQKSVKIGQIVGYQAPGVLISQLEKYVGK